MLSKTKKILMVGFLINLFSFIPRCLAAESYWDKQVWLDLNPFRTIGSVAGGLVSSAVEGLALAIATFFGWVISLEAKVLSWVVDLGHFTQLTIVQQGWKICRDFSNLFFIAILIYIAFAIILRLQSANPKKMLFKVVFMAIAINFSLMIGGMIIDFSQVLFKYFVFSSLVDKGGVGFSQEVANAFKIQTFMGPDAQGTIEEQKGVSNVFTRLLFIIIFLGLVVIVFGAVTLTLFIRNFWLWILLISAPLAWFLSIVPIPILSKYASQWWNNFLKWCFIAPIMGFFIFLSFQIIAQENKPASEVTPVVNQSELSNAWKASENGREIFSFQGLKNSIFNPSNVISMLVTCVFLIGGLMAGQSLGSGAAKGALSMVNKAGKNTQKWMGRKAMQSPPARGVGNVLMGMGNIPLIGGVFKRAGMATQGGAVKAQKDDLKSAEGRVKNLSEKQIKDNWKSFNQWEKQAAAKKLGNDKLDQKQFEDMQSIYSRAGMDKERRDMEKALPHFTSDFKKEAEKLKEANREFTKADDNHSAIDSDVKKLEEENKTYKTDKNAAEERVKGLERAGADATEAKEALGKTAVKLEESDAKLKEMKGVREGAFKVREKTQKDLDKTRAPILERFKDADLSKLNLADLIKDKDSAQAQALIDVIASKSPNEIVKVVSKLERKGDDGKKDFSRTADFRKEMSVNIAENLYLHGGAEESEKMASILKLTKLDSSPSAWAEGRDFKNIINSMKDRTENEVEIKGVFGEETAEKINKMSTQQKKTEKVIKRMAEIVGEEIPSEDKKKNEKIETESEEIKKSKPEIEK